MHIWVRGLAKRQHPTNVGEKEMIVVISKTSISLEKEAVLQKVQAKEGESNKPQDGGLTEGPAAWDTSYWKRDGEKKR